MRRSFLLTLLALSCRDPATLVGTAVVVTVDSSDVRVEQLRYSAWILDAGSVLEPTTRPATPAGLLATSTTVRVLLKDSLGGQTLEVHVDGLVDGGVAGDGHGEVRVDKGFERPLVVKLLPPTPMCQGCIGPQGDCVSEVGPQACGKGGAACVVCDSVMADGCSASGACGCGDGPPCSAALGADRCEGGKCRCGAGAVCTAGQECLAQTCQCTPTSCAGGCCQGNMCVTAPTSSACGTGGRACLDCGGSACSAGQCAMSACNQTTCPTGCCIGSSCVTAQTNLACGKGGIACESCGAGSCDGGVCSGSCSPATCPNGCCQGGVCLAGTTGAACGTGGAACNTCPGACTNQRCESSCGPATCPQGCCQAGSCRAGDVVGACGTGGASCVACGGGTSCSDAGVCVVSSTCNAMSCTNGCCDGTTCQAPPTDTACGLNGTRCVACVGTLSDRCLINGTCGCGAGPACVPGQVCDGGACQCDPATCGGCCDGAVCASGTARPKCGRDGGVCVACASLQCRMGVCQ
ncbi:MAG: hypothetical protein JNJ54_23745 [Myxococcaceae bacterium]|nr:hypothetical protein [Myxococcaceae bacterium]